MSLTLLPQLALVAAAVLMASLVARRFGHAVAGTLAGLPVIAGPVIGFVLLREPLPQARAIALATLVCLPASIVHMTTFAHLARRWPWWSALLASNTLLAVVAATLLSWRLPVAAVVALALASPAIGLVAMPRRPPAGASASAPVPKAELGLRVGVAVAMAAAILLAAGSLPALVSGVLLAVPIAGNVLPCFTLPRHGAAATVALLTGFVRGLAGFAAFFATLFVALGATTPARAYGLAWAVALSVAVGVYWRGRAVPAGPIAPSTVPPLGHRP